MIVCCMCSGLNVDLVMLETKGDNLERHRDIKTAAHCFEGIVDF